MEDKRVRKTKQSLKQAMLRRLAHQPLEQITVKELCELSDVSRITFYAHYTDKYALMDDICADLVEAARRDFHALQVRVNPYGRAVDNFCCLLDCILNLYIANDKLFWHTVCGDSPYLNALFDRYLQRYVVHRIRRESHALAFCYPPEQTAAVLIHALWGFFREGCRAGQSIGQIRPQARALLRGLLSAGVLMGRGER